MIWNKAAIQFQRVLIIQDNGMIRQHGQFVFPVSYFVEQWLFVGKYIRFIRNSDILVEDLFYNT